MTKRDLQEAYDRMSPSEEAKMRMLRNILPQENKTRKHRVRPQEQRRFSALPAVLALAAMLTVCFLLLRPEAAPNPLTDLVPPKESTEGFLFVEPNDYASRFAGIDERYQEILVTYAQAIDENWSEELWCSAGLNAELYSEADYAGYSLMDLDGNGVFELLICAGNEIYEIYAILEDDASRLLNRTDVRCSIQLCEDNIIRAIENGDRFGGTYYTMYRLGNDGLGVLAMVSEEIVFVTAEGDWYAGPYEKDAVPVTEAEANAALKKYVDAVLSVTTFSDAEQQEPGDVVPAGYSYILNKYIQAATDNWTPEEYMQNDISYPLAGMDIFTDYGYALIDCNADGIDELIITDGEYIYDMYIRMDDGGAGHILTSGDRMRYFLCDGHIIGYQGSSGAANSCWEYSRLLPGGDSEIVMYLQLDTDTYYMMEGGSEKMVAVTKDEAGEIINTYRSVEILFQPILRAEMAEEKLSPSTYAEALQQLIDFAPGIESMYMSLVDISGDGNSELLLGTADSFGTVYTLREDGLHHVISYGTDEGFTLCADGIIAYHTPDDPYGQYTFISVKNNEPDVVEEILYDKEAGKWFRYKTTGKEYFKDYQVSDLLASYCPLSVTMIPVADYLAGE